MLLAGQGEAWLEGYLEGVALAAITPRTIVDPGRLGVELRRVRRQGFALVDQELEEGLRALAVAIREPGGAVVGAVNVAVHTSRWTVEAIRGRLLPRLRAAAAAIETDLGAAGVAAVALAPGGLSRPVRPAAAAVVSRAGWRRRRACAGRPARSSPSARDRRAREGRAGGRPGDGGPS